MVPPLFLVGLVWAGFLRRALGFVLSASPCVSLRQCEATKVFLSGGSLCYGWVIALPLTRAVVFKTLLQKGNRVQVPKLVRWEFKMETTQVLEVEVKLSGSWESESFYGKMSKDGRITVPWLVLDLLQKRTEDGKSLTGQVLEVRIAPAERSSSTATEQ
jgi:hypothetical protein